MLMHPYPAHLAADLRRTRLRVPVPDRPHIARRVVTEWSESCACGASTLGHEEEPCRPNCTGYYPIRWWYRLQGGGCGQAAGQDGESLRGPVMEPCDCH
ncbi:hypothetical protein AB0N09_05170 [Streptomyces erythrochromogenes]|uniref:hypothetical protein n=1 Tax=Streptomyces erythrochromogenes TaxID=285574 RepID=UPI003437CBAF